MIPSRRNPEYVQQPQHQRSNSHTAGATALPDDRRRAVSARRTSGPVASTANLSPTRRNGEPTHRNSTRFTIEEIAEALRAGHGNIAEAARYLKARHGRSLSYVALTRNINASPELRALRTTQLEIALDYVESQLWRQIEAGNLQAIHFFLSRKGRSRGYGKQAEPANVPPQVERTLQLDLDGIPVDRLRITLEVLAEAREAAARNARVTGTEHDECAGYLRTADRPVA